MRFSEEVEDKIESLTCDELRGVMDHIMRAAADRGYFGDKTAMNEIVRIIRNPKSEGRTRRLFPKELVDGKRTRSYPRTVYVSEMSVRDQENIDYRLREALRKEGYEGEELEDLVERGLDSRLRDLEDTISIDRYVRD